MHRGARSGRIFEEITIEFDANASSQLIVMTVDRVVQRFRECERVEQAGHLAARLARRSAQWEERMQRVSVRISENLAVLDQDWTADEGAGGGADAIIHVHKEGETPLLSGWFGTPPDSRRRSALPDLPAGGVDRDAVGASSEVRAPAANSAPSSTIIGRLSESDQVYRVVHCCGFR